MALIFVLRSHLTPDCVLFDLRQPGRLGSGTKHIDVQVFLFLGHETILQGSLRQGSSLRATMKKNLDERLAQEIPAKWLVRATLTVPELSSHRHVGPPLHETNPSSVLVAPLSDRQVPQAGRIVRDGLSALQRSRFNFYVPGIGAHRSVSSLKATHCLLFDVWFLGFHAKNGPCSSDNFVPL